jgi:hypothetical protein
MNLSNIYEVLQTSWEVVLCFMAATKGTALSLSLSLSIMVCFHFSLWNNGRNARPIEASKCSHAGGVEFGAGKCILDRN